MVGDANFLIQLIGAFHSDLRFFRVARMWGLDDFLDRPGEGSTGLLSHGFSFEVRVV
jgi:hypothetical protein